jgi:hypothetical protein
MCKAEVARDQSNDVPNLETRDEHDGLNKRAQKAVLHVRGAGENQNDGETASRKKNKTLEELSKNHPK